MRFEKHIFICANQKDEGKKCCGAEHGMAMVNRFREILKEKGLHTKIRAQKSGCLDACSKGAALVIYPEGTYYGNVQLNDVEKIIESHIVNGKVLQELALTWD